MDRLNTPPKTPKTPLGDAAASGGLSQPQTLRLHARIKFPPQKGFFWALEQSAQGGGGAAIPGGAKKRGFCGGFSAVSPYAWTRGAFPRETILWFLR